MSVVRTIEIHSEREATRGWVYTVVLHRSDGASSEHEVSLAWADHDYWSGGALPPSKVVERVIQFALEHRAEEDFPARFDAARVRRWLPRLDETFRGG